MVDILQKLIQEYIDAFWRFSKQAKVHEVMFFWYLKIMSILKVYLVHFNWDKTHMLKKNYFEQNKRYKKCPLFSFASSNSPQIYF